MNNHMPLRMCIACREMKNKNELIRFAVHNDKVVMDTTQKIQARGAYVCRDAECIGLARKKRCLERHLKAECADVYQQLESLFVEADDE